MKLKSRERKLSARRLRAGWWGRDMDQRSHQDIRPGQSSTLQTGLSGIETSQNNKGPYFGILYASPVHMKRRKCVGLPNFNHSLIHENRDNISNGCTFQVPDENIKCRS